MRVLVTGAGGFVGSALARRLIEGAAGIAVEALVAVDQKLDPGLSWTTDRRVTVIEGDFSGRAALRAAEPCDLVFHLASIPGGLAERTPLMGRRINLDACLELFDRLAQTGRTPAKRVVFASSVAVYGPLGSAPVDEELLPAPELSYGTHKLMAELMLADLSRRGALDGLSLRLPGIVARPPNAGGHGSAFMSELFHRVHAGQPYTCPTSPDASCWWMSLRCCVDNLIHAATTPAHRIGGRRVVQLPVLTATVESIVDAAATRYGRPSQIRYAPDATIERLFGSLPVLHTPKARELGFRDDSSLGELASAALNAG